MKIIQYAFALACISTIATHTIFPCAMTIVNDLSDPVIITTNDDAQCIFVLLPGDEKEFGDHHVKAKFTVLIKDNAGNYIQHLAVRQYACFAGKQIRLHTQDLVEQHINGDLFMFGKPGEVDLRKREICH